MDAVKYLKTLSRMKETDAFSVDEFIAFIGKTPEHKVEFVEKWGMENMEEEDPGETDIAEEIRRIKRDIEYHNKLIEKIQWIILQEQLRIDDCEDDIIDLRAEVSCDFPEEDLGDDE